MNSYEIQSVLHFAYLFPGVSLAARQTFARLSFFYEGLNILVQASPGGAIRMLKGISTIFGGICRQLLKDRNSVEKNSVWTSRDHAKTSLSDEDALLIEAKQRWQAAHSFFNYVNDEGQIDQAIFNLIAAEKHYDYLLRKARREHWYNRKVDKEV